MNATERFAALHRGPAPLLLPNAWDVAGALALQDAGFPAIGTTSLGITAAAGLPDGAGAGRDLTLALARRLVELLRVPVTVDLEGGYSDDPAEVAALVGELAREGVAGVNLEDGRADGSLRPVEQHAEIVAAAASTGVFVNARTDTYWLEHTDPLPETLRRVTAYERAGSDGVFVPGIADPGETASVVEAVAVPLNVLHRRGTTTDHWRAAGVRRVSTGSALYRAALGTAVAEATAARDGLTAPAAEPLSYEEIQRLIDSSRQGATG